MCEERLVRSIRAQAGKPSPAMQGLLAPITRGNQIIPIRTVTARQCIAIGRQAVNVLQEEMHAAPARTAKASHAIDLFQAITDGNPDVRAGCELTSIIKEILTESEPTTLRSKRASLFNWLLPLIKTTRSGTGTLGLGAQTATTLGHVLLRNRLLLASRATQQMVWRWMQAVRKHRVQLALGRPHWP